MSAPNRSQLEGWRIVLATTLVLGGISGLAAAGTVRDPWLWLTRATARLSLVLFIVTFGASSVQTLLRGRFGNWLRRTIALSCSIPDLPRDLAPPVPRGQLTTVR